MRSRQSSALRRRLPRLPLLFLAILSLAAGVWGGLVRLPLNLPLPSDNANWLSLHGPLMVCGFLGTVISLERAVGLQKVWPYVAPLCTALGGLMIVAGALGRPAVFLITVGSAAFCGVTLYVVSLQRALFTVTMALGAMLWLAGNLFWYAGREIPQFLLFWVGFLCLTIVGERLDLSRFHKTERWAGPAMCVCLFALIAAAAIAPTSPAVGFRGGGFALVALAVWLARFDLARRTIHLPGLSRFMAIALLSGYVWLVVSGLLFAVATPLEPGTTYDAALHAFFIGFVFAMIFGHAPVIFPAVLELTVRFRPRFYVHLGLLHISVAIRLVGDLAGFPVLRQWGAILNAVAFLLFLVNTFVSLWPDQKSGPQYKEKPQA